jgi:hypothetical protein
MIEMEQGLQKMMGRVLARQEGAAAQIAAYQEEMKACDNKTNAEARNPPETMKRGHNRPYVGPSRRIEILRKRDDVLPSIVTGLSLKSKASPDEMEADVNTIEDRSSKMETTDLEGNSETT